jgi:cell division protein FtsI (penicillin-binding protein 3)
MASREGLILLVFIAVALVVMVRLLLLTVVDADALAADGKEKRVQEYSLTARRGTIFDRKGNILATSVEATTVYANPSEITEPAKTAAILAGVLGGDAQKYLAAISADPAATFVYIAQKADKDTAQKLVDLAQEYRAEAADVIRARGDDVPAELETPLSGIYYLPDTKREYPYGQIGAQIIGSLETRLLDENGREISPEADVANKRESFFGASGLEQTYDSILRGVDGKMVVQRGAATSPGEEALPLIGGVEELIPATDGQDIIVTLDIELQQYLEYNLEAQAAQRNCDNAHSLLLDGATGEILAGASIPLYTRDNLSAEAVANGATNLKALTLPYEPGSTFKACIAAVALERGVMQAEDRLFCPAELKIYDRTIKDVNARPDVEYTLREIIALSSNVGAALMADRVGKNLFGDYLQRFGFGQYSHVDYPGETQGNVAEAEQWNPVQAANIAFGQGLEVSSLQMASLYGAIANDGLLIQPHFLLARPQFDVELRYESKQVLEPATARKLEELLRAVVTEGTGKAADISGLDVVGKTGTAEKAAKGDSELNYLKDEFITSFVGYIDNSNSKLVFISSFDNPTNYVNAPSTAFFANIMSFVANRYMIVPEEEPDPKLLLVEPSAVESGEGVPSEATADGSALDMGEQTDEQNAASVDPGASFVLEATGREVWILDTSG